MSRRSFLLALGVMLVLAAAVRVHNAMTVSVLGGYDAFAHFTYVWFLALTGKVPLAEAGWQFFQPPLYYAAMAALWNALDGIPGEIRLRAGTVAIALAGLVQAGAAVALVRTTFPHERRLHLLAAGLMLFLPVHLYSSGYVGNETLNAALAAVALLALLWTLDRPGAGRAAVLGIALGLAMLTKFTAIVVVAAALGTLLLKGIATRRTAAGARTAAIAGAAMLAVCGWFYLRNVVVYGDPFHMSREQLFLARVENSQLQGRREWLEYVLFDPVVLYRPQWPRGLSLNSPRPPGVPYSALRESIPTGLYANTWFDGFGGFAVPPVTYSEASRRAGQLLLTLGLVPTLAMALGAFVALRSLVVRRTWDDAAVASLLALVAMAGVVVIGTRSVPTQAAVKATYLMPVSPAFAYLFAVGAGKVLERAPRLFRAGVAACAVLATAAVLVFTNGLVIDTLWLASGEEAPVPRNVRGVIAYAAGERDAAARHFEASARAGWHLGYENLAALAFEQDDPERAAWLLLEAARRQPAQAPGRTEERERAIATTQAEYASTLAVLERAVGHRDEALGTARRAVRLDAAVPEAHYNLAVLELERSAGGGPESHRYIETACTALARSVELDPAFEEAGRLRGVCLARLGDCEAARPWLDGPSASRPGTRAWPVETGPGDLYAAGLHRRRRIEPLPATLGVEAARELCAGR